VGFDGADIPRTLNDDVVDGKENVCPTEVRVTVEVEKMTRLQRTAVRGAAEHNRVGFLLLDPAPGAVLTSGFYVGNALFGVVKAVGITAGVFEYFELRRHSRDNPR